MGQHIPLTHPMEISNRVEDFLHIDLAQALRWRGLAGGSIVPPGPLLVRQI